MYAYLKRRKGEVYYAKEVTTTVLPASYSVRRYVLSQQVARDAL